MPSSVEISFVIFTPPGPLFQIVVLMKDLGELVMDIEEVLKNHLTVLNINDPKDVDKLSHRIE